MALFYSPTVRKPKKKPLSKTAMKKNFRELRKLFKELGEYDKTTKDTVNNLEKMMEK